MFNTRIAENTSEIEAYWWENFQSTADAATLSTMISAIWVNSNLRKVPEGVVPIGNLMEAYETEFFKL